MIRRARQPAYVIDGITFYGWREVRKYLARKESRA